MSHDFRSPSEACYCIVQRRSPDTRGHCGAVNPGFCLLNCSTGSQLIISSEFCCAHKRKNLAQKKLNFPKQVTADEISQHGATNVDLVCARCPCDTQVCTPVMNRLVSHWSLSLFPSKTIQASVQHCLHVD